MMMKNKGLAISTEDYQELYSDSGSGVWLNKLKELGYIEECFKPGLGWKFSITDKGNNFYTDNNVSQESLEEDELGSLALEAIMHSDQRKVTKTHKFLLKLVGLMGNVPKMTYDREDWNPKIVERLMKYPDLLKTVADWIAEPDQKHIGNLIKAFKTFAPIQPRYNIKKLYRGFNLTGSGQQALGLKTKGFFRKKPANFVVGGKMEYVTDKAVSFTEYEVTATAFGNAIVSIDYNKYRNRLLNIDPNLIIAVSRLDDPTWEPQDHGYYYAEHVLLPSPEPIEFTIEAFGKQKAQVK